MNAYAGELCEDCSSGDLVLGGLNVSGGGSDTKRSVTLTSVVHSLQLNDITSPLSHKTHTNHLNVSVIGNGSVGAS